MKKIFKNPILMFILGGIVLGSIGVYAATSLISSNEVTYNDTTAKAAIDDLYTKVNTMYTKAEYDARTPTLTKVGSWSSYWGGASNTTFNLTSLSNCHDLTTSNFIAVLETMTGAGHDGNSLTLTVSRSYNASTCVLTVSGLSGSGGHWSGIERSTGSVYVLGN